jgi:hypothetical protein
MSMVPIVKMFSKIQLSSGTQALALCLQQCRNLTLKECEDETHTPEMGTWESYETPKI